MRVHEEIKKENTTITLGQVYCYLTEGCNLACRHCWLNPKFQDGSHAYPFLPLKLFQAIISQALPLGLSAVKLTGGEPLMHPQIYEILNIINGNNLVLYLETNGILCSRQLAGKIAACNTQMVSVSLDGTDAETHESIRGVNGCFSQALTGIKYLVDAGIKLQVIMTLMKNNVHQVPDMVLLAESLGASSIKFGIVNPSGRGENITNRGETLKIEAILKLNDWIYRSLVPSTRLKLFLAVPSAFRRMSDMYGLRGDGCLTCGVQNMIGVLASGHYALCGIGTNIPELVFGNAATDRLNDIWNNNKILRQLRGDIHSRFEGICGKCHMKRACHAFCIAQNYYRSGSLWSSYWFCEEAYRAGLFPRSRIVPGPFDRNGDAKNHVDM